MKKISYWFRYRKLVRNIEDLQIYDGRGKGVDVYRCDKCGERVYTCYKDKGVTPFTIRCRLCVGGTMRHVATMDFWSVPIDYAVREWYRPTFKEMLALPKCTIEHVLDGGLILEGRNYE